MMKVHSFDFCRVGAVHDAKTRPMRSQLFWLTTLAPGTTAITWGSTANHADAKSHLDGPDEEEAAGQERIANTERGVVDQEQEGQGRDGVLFRKEKCVRSFHCAADRKQGP